MQKWQCYDNVKENPKKIQRKCTPLKGSIKNMQPRLFYDSGKNLLSPVKTDWEREGSSELNPWIVLPGVEAMKNSEGGEHDKDRYR